jgi:hypothetical protein
MHCHDTWELLSAAIDAPLPPAEAAALAQHLAHCSECRAAAEALQTQDRDLRQAFQPQTKAAERVAARVLEALSAEQSNASPRIAAAAVRGSSYAWLPLCLAAAAGFLLAVLVFRPWQTSFIASRPPAGGAEPGETSAANRSAPAAARLVVATGAVQMRPSQTADWQPCTVVKSYVCPSGSAIRTGPDVACELKTADGCVVRMNRDTEITLISSTSVEIERGQIWCSSPKDVALRIRAPQARRVANAEPPTHKLGHRPWIACPSNSCLTTAVDGGAMQVMTAAGRAELQTAEDRQRLMPGEIASIVDGAIVRSPQPIDPMLAAGWIHPLLCHSPEGERELAERIRQMLERLDDTPAALTYERELRKLGEHAAAPLLDYVLSSAVEGPPQRLAAMRLLCDLAPGSLAPRLLPLLSDADGEIRVLAAQTLKRLSGLDQGRPAEQWRDSLDECAPAIERWRKWLEENRQRLPAAGLQFGCQPFPVRGGQDSSAGPQGGPPGSRQPVAGPSRQRLERIGIKVLTVTPEKGGEAA